MEKLKLHSPDLVAANIRKIADLFPGCVTEAFDENGKLTRSIDFDQLRQELSGHVVEGPRERYHLDWPGKRAAMLAANAPIAKTLRPCREESVNFDTTRNLFIEGDNLDALKLLQETYLGKVKLIYIDPPYNTGNDFIYEDNFAEDSASYLHRSNQTDEAGNRMVANTEANGRFHSDWLSMLYPRLVLARRLLADEGVIFVSIADHEVGNLRLMLDEVFGSKNFIATVIWQKVYAPKSSAKHFSEDHDYIVVYARDAETWRPALLPRTEEQDLAYKNPDNDPRGPWRPNNLAARNYYSKGTYAITCPSGRIIPGPPSGSYWRVSEDRFRELDRDGRIWWGENGGNVPAPKIYLSEVKGGRVPQTLWFYKEVGHNQEAKKELLKLLPVTSSAAVFDTPKPVRLIDRILDIATTPDGESIVLDFFSGSGTTGHAVMMRNAADGGDRRYICIQLPMVLDEVAQLSDGTLLPTISALARERLRRASTPTDAQGTLSVDADFGFRVLKVDTSNMKDIYYAPDASKQGDLLAQVDNIKPDRTPEDLLFQVLIDWGVDLGLPIAQERIADRTVFFVDSNALAACFDTDVSEDLVKEIAKRQPLRVVFRDSSFASDSVKINVEQIFKLVSPSTEVRTI